MFDILLLVGVALCGLSVLLAVMALLQTRPPRSAAIALILGMIVLFSVSWLSDRPLDQEVLSQTWQRVISGESFNPPPAPAPEATTTQTTPETATDAATGTAPAPAQ